MWEYSGSESWAFVIVLYLLYDSFISMRDNTKYKLKFIPTHLEERHISSGWVFRKASPAYEHEADEGIQWKEKQLMEDVLSTQRSPSICKTPSHTTIYSVGVSGTMSEWSVRGLVLDSGVGGACWAARMWVCATWNARPLNCLGLRLVHSDEVLHLKPPNRRHATGLWHLLDVSTLLDARKDEANHWTRALAEGRQAFQPSRVDQHVLFFSMTVFFLH